MFLSESGVGERVIVKNVNVLGKEKRRLYDLGVVPGVSVVKKFSSMFNDPILYEVKGTNIGIRSDEAKLIEVEYE